MTEVLPYHLPNNESPTTPFVIKDIEHRINGSTREIIHYTELLKEIPYLLCKYYIRISMHEMIPYILYDEKHDTMEILFSNQVVF